MEDDEEIKRAIIGYVKEYKGVPPVKTICRRFKITIKRFYTFFPGKMPELCRLAGKPLPVERMKRTEKAIKSRSTTQTIGEDMEPSLIQLTREQSRRLLGISHLEKGKDPLIIIDELFDRDSKLRKTYKLSLSKTKLLCDFLEDLKKRGWDPFKFVDYGTKYRNAIYWFTRYMEGTINLKEFMQKQGI